MTGGTLNLSLLSRGVGEIHTNGHEKVDVYLESEDYLNFSNNMGKLYLPRIPPKDPLTHADNSTSKDVQLFRVPKTYSTRRGALLLFSEDLALRNSGANVEVTETQKTNASTNELNSQVSLKTVEDLAKSILKYGSQGHLNDNIYLKFVRAHCGTFERQFRPGFSAKRYLSTWTRTWDDSVLDNIIKNGYLAERSLYHQNLAVSYFRKRLVFDDLSRMPEPYKLMRNMLLTPDSLSGYTFYSALTPDIDEREALNQNTDAAEVKQKPDRLHNIRVVRTRGKVQREVIYSELDQASQKDVITDLLVKSAVSYAMRKQEEIYKDWVMKAMNEQGQGQEGKGDVTRVSSVIQEFDMRDAVESLLESQGPFPDIARIDDDDDDDFYSIEEERSLRGVATRGARNADIEAESNVSGHLSQRSDNSETTPGLYKFPALPPIRVTLSPIKDSSRETSKITSLPPLVQGDGVATVNKGSHVVAPDGEVVNVGGSIGQQNGWSDGQYEESASGAFNITESDIMEMLSCHARQVAENVISQASAGIDLGTDVEGVIDDLTASRPGSNDTVDKHNSLVMNKVSGLEGNVEVSPQLSDATINQKMTPEETDIDGHSRMQVKSKPDDDFARRQISIPDGSMHLNDDDEAELGQGHDKSQKQQKSMSRITDHKLLLSRAKSDKGPDSVSMIKHGDETMVDGSKTAVTQQKSTAVKSSKKKTKDSDDPFIVGMPKEKKLPATQPSSQKGTTKEKKKQKKTEGKVKKKSERKPTKQKSGKTGTRKESVEDLSEPTAVQRQKSPKQTSPDIHQSRMSSPGLKSEGSDLDFSFVREQTGSIVSDLKELEDHTVGDAMSKLQVSSGVFDDDDDNLDSEFGDDGEASKLKSISNREARAAKQAAAALKRREEVEKRRKLKEEQAKREKEEIERQIELQKELEEQRRKGEEDRRLRKEQQMEEEERERLEAEEAERRQKLEAERERRAKEEFQRKLEEMRRKQQEEEMKRKELLLLKQKEEAERVAAEELMLSKMEKHERLEYERLKKEEEEARRKKELEDKLRREEEARVAMEEARRITEEMSRKQAELEARLQFNRSLQEETKCLTQAHTINRAFVFSYFELLQWLGLDIPEFELAKVAD